MTSIETFNASLTDLRVKEWNFTGSLQHRYGLHPVLQIVCVESHGLYDRRLKLTGCLWTQLVLGVSVGAAPALLLVFSCGKRCQLATSA